MRKKNYFLAWCGEELFSTLTNIFHPIKLSEASITYDDLIKKLNAHFNEELNFMAATYSLYSCKQKPGQSVQEWLHELRERAKHCGFESSCITSVRERAMRDLIVLNCADVRTRQALLKEGDPTLQRAEEIAVQMEQLSRDLRELQPSIPRVDVAKVHSSKQKGKVDIGSYKCFSCGKSNHKREKCKYRNYTCNLCNVKGHLQAVCKKNVTKKCDSKSSVHTLSSVYEICGNKRTDSPIFLTCSVMNKCVDFEVDTGSSVSIIDEGTWKMLGSPRLQLCNTKLRSYTGQILPVKGHCDMHVSLLGKTYVLNMKVVEGKRSALLGRDSIVLSGLDLNALMHDFMPSSSNVNMCTTSTLDSLLTEYKDVFAKELGHCKKFKAKLQLKDGAIPKFHKPRSVPFAKLEPLKQELQRLEDNGTCSKITHSEWAAPIVLVPKPDGRIRVCGDFKMTVNPQLQTDQYPLPTPNELLIKMNGGKKFTKLDLADAYTQIELDDESKKMVVINTANGLYSYNRLAYGIASAVAIFQRLADDLIRDIPYTAAYIDDIIITGPSDEEHIRSLRMVLSRIREYGLRLKEEKCSFMQNEVTYLGHKIDKDGKSPDQDRVQAILKIPAPTCVKELECFLGKINYYGQFVKDVSSISEPLNNLRRKDVKWCWDKACSNAFEELKNRLAKATLLVHYDPKAELLLATDASNYGIGAVLLHKDSFGNERPIAHASKSLSVAERNYSQIEKEALGIVYGIKKFKQYLLGRKFKLITDHKPLLSIFHPQKKIPETTAARLQRWAILLMAYEYEIEYRGSKDHTNADSLSRLPVGPDKTFFDQDSIAVCALYEETLENIPLDSELIKADTKKDSTLIKVMEFVKKGWPHKTENSKIRKFFKVRNELSVQNGTLFRGLRLVIPEKLRGRCLQLLHSSHMGINRMKQCARTSIWWPGIDSDITLSVQGCETCQRTAGNVAESFVSWPTPASAWDRFHIDFAGPFWGEKWLVGVDAMSKFPFVIPMGQDTTASATSSALEAIFALFGPVKTIVSDNGPPFNSKEMDMFYKKWNIHHVTSSPFRPQGNGLAEKFVRTFKQSMLKFKEEGMNKALALREFLRDYRFSPHCSTRKIPAEMVFSYNCGTKLTVLKPTKEESTNQDPRGQKVWVRQYFPKKVWIPGEIVGKKGRCTFIVSVCGGRLWKRHVTQIKDRISDVANHSEFHDVLSDDLLDWTAPSTPPVVSAPPSARGASPLVGRGWRSRRSTKGVPPTRFL